MIADIGLIYFTWFLFALIFLIANPEREITPIGIAILFPAIMALKIIRFLKKVSFQNDGR